MIMWFAVRARIGLGYPKRSIDCLSRSIWLRGCRRGHGLRRQRSIDADPKAVSHRLGVDLLDLDVAARLVEQLGDLVRQEAQGRETRRASAFWRRVLPCTQAIEEGIERAGDVGGRGRRRLDRGAKWPGTPGHLSRSWPVSLSPSVLRLAGWDDLVHRQSRPFRCRHQSYARKRVTLGIPVVTLDVDGVGELIRLAVDRGRAARPGLKLGICGEHGGDPMSIGFCQAIGLDYVSCSPFRIPIARLAAAQAVLAVKGRDTTV
jgi:hypothetical protein